MHFYYNARVCQPGRRSCIYIAQWREDYYYKKFLVVSLLEVPANKAIACVRCRIAEVSNLTKFAEVDIIDISCNELYYSRN